MTRRFTRALLVVLLAAAWSGPRPADATLTDPVLGISRVTRAQGALHELMVVEADFPFDDLVQLAVPLQVMVFDRADGSYVRLEVSGGAVGGQDTALLDGISPAEALALLTAGTAAPSVSLTGLAPGRLTLQAARGVLPPAAASTRVQLFLLREGEITLSNAVPAELAP